MSKKILTIWIIIFLIVIIGVSTYLIKTNQKKDKIEITVSWNEAIRILNSGEVEKVFQTHNLDVTLTLEDGRSIKTKEPDIDYIFDEIKKCGNPCKNMVIATE